jgi:hypothetical protein
VIEMAKQRIEETIAAADSCAHAACSIPNISHLDFSTQLEGH